MKAGAISLLLLLNGCATTTKSTLLGAAIGGAAGGMVGQAESRNSQGTAIGLAIGAGVGGLIGYLAHKGKGSKEATPATPFSDGDLLPSLTKPKIRSIVVPDTIEGNKYIKSHRVFILEDAGSWSRD
ncbi:MAG: hypothetical protein C5B49_12365 [Bdellovibrio sp.]|nr:MAG: hypothetical protein C5B49_12365 [Bdellovibrio sp.]